MTEVQVFFSVETEDQNRGAASLHRGLRVGAQRRQKLHFQPDESSHAI